MKTDKCRHCTATEILRTRNLTSRWCEKQSCSVSGRSRLHIPAQWPPILTYASNGFPSPQANKRAEYKMKPLRYLFTSVSKFVIHYWVYQKTPHNINYCKFHQIKQKQNNNNNNNLFLSKKWGSRINFGS
jgi:hypothetical protein